jgi:hypothetical protein
VFHERRPKWRQAVRYRGERARINPEHWIIAAIVLASYMFAALALVNSG